MDKGLVPLSTLRRCPLFKGMGEAELLALGAQLRLRRLRAGEPLYFQGEAGDALHIILEGRVALRVALPGGDALLSEGGLGDALGLGACLEPAARAASAMAQGDAAVLQLDRAALAALRAVAPEAAVALVGALIGRVTARLRESNRYIERALPARARGPGSLIFPAMGSGGATPPSPEPYRGAVDLSGLPSLEGLTPRDLELLVSVAPPMHYPDGATLCTEGASASSCFLVAKGEVLVLKMVGSQLRELGALGPGSFVGQLALVDRAPRSATVRASGAAVVLTLGREDFERLLAARSPLAMRFQEQIALAGVRQLRMAAGRLRAVLERAPAVAPAAWAPSRGLSQPESDAALAHLQAAVVEWDLALVEDPRDGDEA